MRGSGHVAVGLRDLVEVLVPVLSVHAVAEELPAIQEPRRDRLRGLRDIAGGALVGLDVGRGLNDVKATTQDRPAAMAHEDGVGTEGVVDGALDPRLAFVIAMRATHESMKARPLGGTRNPPAI